MTGGKVSASIRLMLKIRLQRVGRKHEPTYRIVLTDSQNGPKSGNFIEVLGSYDARDKNETTIKADRVKHWIDNGAQVSDTIHNLLVGKGIIDGKKKNVLPKKSPIVDEEAIAKAKEAEEKAKAEAEAAAAAPAEETPAETEAPAETPAEEPATEEAPAEETKEA